MSISERVARPLTDLLDLLHQRAEPVPLRGLPERLRDPAVVRASESHGLALCVYPHAPSKPAGGQRRKRSSRKSVVGATESWLPCAGQEDFVLADALAREGGNREPWLYIMATRAGREWAAQQRMAESRGKAKWPAERSARRGKSIAETPDVSQMLALTLWEQGSHYRAIGQVFKVSHETARHWVILARAWLDAGVGGRRGRA